MMILELLYGEIHDISSYIPCVHELQANNSELSGPLIIPFSHVTTQGPDYQMVPILTPKFLQVIFFYCSYT
jgi:hypothetical protein